MCVHEKFVLCYYARGRDQKIRLAYNELTFKKTKDTCKFWLRFLEKVNYREIADKKAAYNEVRLYLKLYTREFYKFFGTCESLY